MSTVVEPEVRAPEGAVKPRRASALRRAPVWGVRLALLLIALWVLFLARNTPAGPAISEPGRFAITMLDGLTYAGLLFVVASGFTLIFGLMRTVNMAHGSLFLLAGFIGIRMQQLIVGKTRNIAPDEVSMVAWVVPLLVGALIAAVVGVIVHQVFLRWNQGQELRQALITLAISVVLADQMLRMFGGLALTMVWPGPVTHFIEIFGQRYATSRLFMLAVAAVVGVLLWLWLTKTRMGMVIRAGVDDEPMVRALGINIGLVFAVTFFVGAFLAGMGGVMGASFSGAATGSDGAWLLNSLVVVIIGGLGSIKGAVAGSLLYGLVVAMSPAYLPSRYTFYSIIFTFVLLALVLAVRPYGLFGRPGTE
ncbi:MAG TPA: branched-chain amino acid ABC transporter permease [Egibacteraceae bacterium]|nr:branched-chain amino acid ABC transporter permease [Egibacteraceae bacterium]